MDDVRPAISPDPGTGAYRLFRYPPGRQQSAALDSWLPQRSKRGHEAARLGPDAGIPVGEISQKSSGIMSAPQDDNRAVISGEHLQNQWALAAAKRAEPSDEFQVDAVIDPELRNKPPAEPQPSPHDSRQAGPRRDVQIDNRIRVRESIGKNSELHPIHHPPVGSDQLTVALGPLLRDGLHPPLANIAPVVSVDMHHRKPRAASRGLERAWSCPLRHSRSRRFAAPSQRTTHPGRANTILPTAATLIEHEKPSDLRSRPTRQRRPGERRLSAARDGHALMTVLSSR